MLLVVSFFTSLLVYLGSFSDGWSWSWEYSYTSPDNLLFKLAFAYAMKTIFLMPLPLLLGVFVRKTKVIYLSLVIILPIIFFSWSLGSQYLEWQKFINVYRYPNATNLLYGKSRCGGTLCSPNYKVIKFETTDSPKQLKEYVLKHIPPSYFLDSVGDPLKIHYDDSIEYPNDVGSTDTLFFNSLPKGKGGKASIHRGD